MRFITSCTALLFLASLPAFSQASTGPSAMLATPAAASTTTTPTVLPPDATDASVDYAALRE